MNVSAEFKLESPFELLHVGVEGGVLHDDLLWLDVLYVCHAGSGQLDGAHSGGAARQTRDAGQGGDRVAALEVDDVRKALLPHHRHRPQPGVAQRHLHHLSGQQLGPVRNKETADPLAAECADCQRFGMV